VRSPGRGTWSAFTACIRKIAFRVPCPSVCPTPRSTRRTRFRTMGTTLARIHCAFQLPRPSVDRTPSFALTCFIGRHAASFSDHDVNLVIVFDRREGFRLPLHQAGVLPMGRPTRGTWSAIGACIRKTAFRVPCPNVCPTPRSTHSTRCFTHERC